MKQQESQLFQVIDAPLLDLEQAEATASQYRIPTYAKGICWWWWDWYASDHNVEELRKAFNGNQKRATDFFGDGAMFLEKLVQNPRHIEIQILADNKG